MNFFEALQTAGYGFCTSEDQLRQALQLGPASGLFVNILEWLDEQLMEDREIYACMQPIIMDMLHSDMDRTPQQLPPFEFRYNLLTLLMAMLCLIQRRQTLTSSYQSEHCGVDMPQAPQLIAAQMDLEWVIVDRTKATGGLSEEKFDILLAALERKITEVGIPVNLNTIYIEQVEPCPGLYKLRFSDFRQVCDILFALALLPLLWKDEDLCLLPWRMHGQYLFTSAWMCVSRPHGATEDLFETLNRQNDINLKNLGFLSVEEHDFYFLQLSERELSVLKRTEGQLKLGSEHIQLLVNQDIGTWADLKHLQRSNNDDSIVSR